MLFSIPAVKGVEFGAGFGFASMKGSEANDGFRLIGGKVKTITNNNGGVLGGISDGMPLIFRCVIKPTPSIFIAQNSINLKSNTEEKIKIEGRHDPCIILRAIPVVEAAAAISLYDLLKD